jgi:hemolysin III
MSATQPAQEEHANALSHALGLWLSAVALPVLAAAHWPVLAMDPARRTGLAVFGISMVLVYLASTVYHACPEGPAKGLLQRLDHAAIYLFMAGSYTPFALRDVPGGPAWTLLGAVWVLATLGMLAKLLNRLRQRGFSTALYLGFGWLVVWAARPLLAQLPANTLALVIAGGLAYSAGTLFFLLDDRLRYGHLVWHLFVLAGSACHLAAVLV